MNKKYAMCAFWIAALVPLGGCGTQPWVKPSERGKLADPTMSLSRDPLVDQQRQHVFSVTEGARGAGTARGSSCGCN